MPPVTLGGTSKENSMSNLSERFSNILHLAFAFALGLPGAIGMLAGLVKLMVH
jgi:hypothetical protein